MASFIQNRGDNIFCFHFGQMNGGKNMPEETGKHFRVLENPLLCAKNIHLKKTLKSWESCPLQHWNCRRVEAENIFFPPDPVCVLRIVNTSFRPLLGLKFHLTVICDWHYFYPENKETVGMKTEKDQWLWYKHVIQTRKFSSTGEGKIPRWVAPAQCLQQSHQPTLFSTCQSSCKALSMKDRKPCKELYYLRGRFYLGNVQGVFPLHISCHPLRHKQVCIPLILRSNVIRNNNKISNASGNYGLLLSTGSCSQSHHPGMCISKLCLLQTH